MAFQTMKNLLPQRLRQTGIARAVAAAQAVETANAVLDQWFGADTSTLRAKAVSVRNKQLTIASFDAAIRFELKRREREFVAAVNRQAGGDCASSLRVII